MLQKLDGMKPQMRCKRSQSTPIHQGDLRESVQRPFTPQPRGLQPPRSLQELERVSYSNDISTRKMMIVMVVMEMEMMVMVVVAWVAER